MYCGADAGAAAAENPSNADRQTKATGSGLMGWMLGKAVASVKPLGRRIC